MRDYLPFVSISFFYDLFEINNNLPLSIFCSSMDYFHCLFESPCPFTGFCVSVRLTLYVERLCTRVKRCYLTMLFYVRTILITKCRTAYCCLVCWVLHVLFAFPLLLIPFLLCFSQETSRAEYHASPAPRIFFENKNVQNFVCMLYDVCLLAGIGLRDISHLLIVFQIRLCCSFTLLFLSRSLFPSTHSSSFDFVCYFAPPFFLLGLCFTRKCSIIFLHSPLNIRLHEPVPLESFNPFTDEATGCGFLMLTM